MGMLIVILLIEAVIFGISVLSKFETDPDMNYEESRQKYLQALLLKAIAVFVFTVIGWWYWHVIQNFLNTGSLENIIQQHRP